MSEREETRRSTWDPETSVRPLHRSDRWIKYVWGKLLEKRQNTLLSKRTAQSVLRSRAVQVRTTPRVLPATAGCLRSRTHKISSLLLRQVARPRRLARRRRRRRHVDGAASSMLGHDVALPAKTQRGGETVTRLQEHRLRTGLGPWAQAVTFHFFSGLSLHVGPARHRADGLTRACSVAARGSMGM